MYEAGSFCAVALVRDSQQEGPCQAAGPQPAMRDPQALRDLVEGGDTCLSELGFSTYEASLLRHTRAEALPAYTRYMHDVRSMLQVRARVSGRVGRAGGAAARLCCALAGGFLHGALFYIVFSHFAIQPCISPACVSFLVPPALPGLHLPFFSAQEYCEQHGCQVLYIQFLAVDQCARGKGLASRLLAHVAGAADAEGKHLYLEASRPATRRMLEKRGFQVGGCAQTSCILNFNLS